MQLLYPHPASIFNCFHYAFPEQGPGAVLEHFT